MTEQQLEKVLVGSPLRISVGEPWDFTSPDGDNLLRGSVVSVRAGADVPYQEQEIELEVTPFEARGGRRVTSLIARARYEDEKGIVERLAAGEDAYINLDYGHQVPERELPDGAKPFLIGGIHLVTRAKDGPSFDDDREITSEFEEQVRDHYGVDRAHRGLRGGESAAYSEYHAEENPPSGSAGRHLALEDLTEEDLAALAGRQPMPPAAVGSGLSDVSENHDHYLYGP